MTGAVTDLYEQEDAILCWWGTRVECTSAIARLERLGSLEPSAATAALARLTALLQGCHEIAPSTQLREEAQRLLRAHDLRAADSLQLAAAIVAAEGQPATLEVVCLDERLGIAAQRAGFAVIDFSVASSNEPKLAQ
jgi:predicted nucleic acid-binding protein